jgi:hypothetical protein
MPQLKIDLSELELAFDSGSDLISFYLDLETGEVISIGEEENDLFESVYESYYDEQSRTVDWESAFEKEHIYDWQREILQIADQIKAGLGERFIDIAPREPYEGYRDMEAFIVTVDDQVLQERLERAIHGRGAFRYFRDVLYDFPAERERWFQFKQERLHQRVLDWLETQGITLLQ